ncbi:MAG: hypothetical protein JSS79_09095 [Bacteroidetes bacterium]|nr:hypothetical protein [Bacteroidota bacterium]
MRQFLALIFFLVLFEANSQSVIIKNVELSGDKIVVHYSLENSNQNAGFLLNLYESKDNFMSPLTKVSGDVGPEVKPGPDKTIVWKVIDEYGNYKGKLSLEIRGKVYVPFVKLQNFDVASSYKRGKSYDVLWKPGNNDPINIELFKGNQRVQGSMNQANNGAYSLNIPSDMKSGKDYHLKISSVKNSDEVVITPDFKVKPKLPLLVKALPILAIGGAVVALGGGSKKDTGGGGSSGGDIPLPALPGN